MKQSLKKMLALALAAGMIASMAACQLKDNGTATAGDATANASRDEIAVKIGDSDEYTVTRGEIADLYDAMVSQYTAYGMAAPTADADIESMQDTVVDMLAQEKLNQYQAKLMGIELDKNASDGVDADVEDEMAYYMDTFRSQAEAEGATDVDARTLEIFNEQLKSSGLDMDVEGYRAYIKEQLTKQAISTALQEKVKSDVEVSDEEVQTYYNDLLDTQKETYASNPEKYLEDEEGFEKFGGDPILVSPEGYVRVKTITISPAEELSADYETLQTDMQKLEAEYGKLSLTDATLNAARIREIATEYKAKKTEADGLYETYIAAAREKANKAYEELKAGKSFDEVLAAYGEDDVYTTYPVFATEGLLMQKGVASSTWNEQLVEAVGKLKNGEYTEVINLDDIFYICQLVGDEPVDEKSFEDVREDIRSQALAQKAETYWNEQQEAWMNDTSLVTTYEDVYRSVGK